MKDNTIVLFFNCQIYTMDQKLSEAEAMAIFNDEIIAIGKETRVREEINLIKSIKNAKLIEKNVGGACIVPGFIDAHMHPAFYIYSKTQCNLSKVRGYVELKNILEKEDKIRPPGDWLVGLDLMEDVFINPEERKFPDRNFLDIFHRPILIFRHDGHICAVNSKALEIIGINSSNAKEKTPEFGEIRLDKDGNPTGILTEDAIGFASAAIQVPDLESFKKATIEFHSELASFGITTIGGVIQIGEFGPAGKIGEMEIELMRVLLNQGIIEQDIVFYFITDKPHKLERLKRTYIKSKELKEKYVIGGVKIYGDGSFGAKTACMFEPFSDSPEHKGFMVNKKEKLHEMVKNSIELGFHVAIHAIGDKANRIIVDVYKDVIMELLMNKEKKFSELTKNEKNHLFKEIKLKLPRLRIEHASILTSDVLDDASELGIIMVCQPAFLNSEQTWLERRVGPERIKHTYAFRSIIDSGIILAGASDAPVESASVMEAIQACVMRNGIIPEEKISVIEALKMFTWNAAHALGQNLKKGSLEKEKLADFVILEKDIKEVQIDELKRLKILETYHRGKLIYRMN
ncbi:MAG: amidohydrolase [Candidatus Lokiarchaeota archaeon]|nr:amidohydrolase [Candidatus Lokiarchaeota archaeon]